MPRERRNASVQARMQINPSASWVISENKGPSIRRPSVAITMACPATRMQDAAIRADENPRGGIRRGGQLELTPDVFCRNWTEVERTRVSLEWTRFLFMDGLSLQCGRQLEQRRRRAATANARTTRLDCKVNAPPPRFAALRMRA